MTLSTDKNIKQPHVTSFIDIQCHVGDVIRIQLSLCIWGSTLKSVLFCIIDSLLLLLSGLFIYIVWPVYVRIVYVTYMSSIFENFKRLRKARWNPRRRCSDELGNSRRWPIRRPQLAAPQPQDARWRGARIPYSPVLSRLELHTGPAELGPTVRFDFRPVAKPRRWRPV